MKENENKELKLDELEQVNGGAIKERKDITAKMENVDERLEMGNALR